MGTHGEPFCIGLVNVANEDGVSDTLTMLNEAGFNSAVDGIPDGVQQRPAEGKTYKEASEDRPVKRKRNKRSLIWRHYEQLDNLAAARCCICMKLQSFEGGSISNLHRHMSNRHPEVFSQLAADRRRRPPTQSSHISDANVEVVLEDGDSDTPDSAMNGTEECTQGDPAQEMSHQEASEDRPVKRKRNKRSLIWRHYEQLDHLAAARCCICMKLQSFEGGSISNLYRHMSNRHPEVFSQLAADRRRRPPTQSSHISAANVEVVLEDGDSDTPDSAMNGTEECTQGDPAEEMSHQEASEDRPVKRKRNKRSLIWRHYEQLDHLAAARCRICMKKLQYFEGGSTSNLHRHMSKRHPEMFSQLLADGQPPLPPPPRSSSHSSGVNDGTFTPPKSAEATEKPRQFSGMLKVSKASVGERCVLQRERELIEAVRAAQREEARALEHQRELLEKLRAMNARETAAEREQIESLRTAQLEEAKDLSRQREEMQKEKSELLKKIEELQREQQ